MEPAARNLKPGAELGRYQILGFLGSGGMGEVYRARDPRLDRDVAIKVLHSAGARDPDRLRRFEQEARAAGQLNHPHILSIFDIGTERDTPYVVSELLEGATLRDALAGNALPMATALDYARQIAQGLSAAHVNGVVHRDLKPENLFVTRDGRVKILDFGLAKLVSSDEGNSAATQTVSGLVIGTIGYMAPEQVRGQRADQRADIFAFGAIFYEMLAGHRAFHGESPADTMSAILNHDPPKLATDWADLPSQMAAVVRRCLEKSPERRFQSASDLSFALDSLTTSENTSASMEAADARAGRLVRGVRSYDRRAIAVVCLVILILIATAIYAGRHRLVDPAAWSRIESLAVLPLDDVSQDAAQAFFAAGLTDALTTELSKISALRVVSRTSAMQFKNASTSANDIARELGVDALVEGTVLRSGDRVRVTAQLIHAASDAHIWADTYERDLSDTLTLQRELVRAIADRIHVALTPKERRGLNATRRVSPIALEAYFKGRAELDRGSTEGFRRALRYFESAAATDGSYAAAYAGIADAHMYLGNYSAIPPQEAFSLAKEAVTKALTLDESLPEAYASLGEIWHNYEWDQVKAEAAYRHAIELNPSSAQARAAYAFFLMKMGRYDEAQVEDAQVRVLDPLSPSVTPAYMSYFQGRYADAVSRWRTHVEQEPGFELAHFFLIRSYLADKRYEEAFRAIDVALKQFPDETRQMKFRVLRGEVLGRTGKRDDALRLAAELIRERRRIYVRPVEIAGVYAAVGDRVRTLEWLEHGGTGARRLGDLVGARAISRLSAR